RERLLEKDLAFFVRFTDYNDLFFEVYSPQIPGYTKAYTSISTPPFYPLDDGLWHHIVTVAHCDVDGAADSLLIFVDGEFVEKVTREDIILDFSTSTGDLTLGSGSSGGYY